ncbi:MAG TPA: dienelactone hydrolase family protein [Phenylobacterium sp.]|nr:dienelactone hydrolase family protein [Phenylobacterium sp.]
MGVFRRRILAGLVLVLLLVAAGAGVTYFNWIAHPRFLAPAARASHAQMMAPGLELVTPSGPGPFPTVLLIHGCGGLHGAHGPNPIMDEYAASAVKAGWAGAILDSYGPRDWEAPWARRRVCTGLRLQGFRRAADVLAGLDLLLADPRVDSHHLRVASWSHGGWAVGDLVTLRDPGDGSFTRTMDQVEAILFTYPYCGFPSQGGRRDWTWRGGLRFVFAENDTVQSAAGCQPLMDRARNAGSQPETVVFPGVTHAFDERVKSANSTFLFDEAATAQAHADFITWLQTAPPSR